MNRFIKNFIFTLFCILFSSSTFAKVSSNSVVVGVVANTTGQQYSEQLYPCNLVVNQMPVNTKLKAESIYGSMVQVALGGNSEFALQGLQKSFGLSTADPALFSTADQWLTQINQLILNLSTENLGVSYSLHVCYLGPIKTLNQTTDVTEKIYTQSTALFLSTLNTAQLKMNTANPMVYRITTKCDLRNVGSQINPRGITELSPLSLGAGLEEDLNYSTNWAPLNESILTSTLVLNPNQTQQVPRFCEFIYDVQESKTTPRNHVEAPLELNLNLDIY